jgi:hypothetical protein
MTWQATSDRPYLEDIEPGDELVLLARDEAAQVEIESRV